MKVLIVFSLVVLAVVAIESSRKNGAVQQCLIVHEHEVNAIKEKYLPLIIRAKTEEEKCKLFAQAMAEKKEITVGICNMDDKTWNVEIKRSYAKFNNVFDLNCKPVETFKFGKKLPLFSMESIKLFSF
uniref:Uncharacterized protein n=1 Tax=Panagrolaimus sp. JU765 TaxID=591449 RepID=A0AC34RH01_9BILA